MNKTRRRALGELCLKIEEAQEALERLQDEEDEFRDTLPQELHTSSRMTESKKAAHAMAKARQSLLDAERMIDQYLYPEADSMGEY